MMIDHKQILHMALCDVPAARKVCDYWPTAERMCLRLSDLILDVLPDPYGDEASMLHRCLILGASNWRDSGSLHNSDVVRFKRFSDGLVKPLSELLDYRVVCGKKMWDPFQETVRDFINKHDDPFRIIRLENRSDERQVVNQRFLSLMMASRIISMDDVFAFQALPGHSLLSFG